MAMAKMRRVCLASAVRAAAARNCEILRFWRVISIADMLPAPRINDVLHRVTLAAVWESPQESGSQAVGIRIPIPGIRSDRNLRPRALLSVGKIAVAKACTICRHSVAACAEILSRSAVDMRSVGSAPILAFAQFGEHRDGIGSSHAEPGLDIGVVGAKKRIRRKLDCDRGWKGEFAGLALTGDRLGALLQDRVRGIDG